MAWAIVPSPKSNEQIEKFIEASDCLSEAIGDAPRTCSEWLAKMKSAQQALTFKAPRFQGGYLLPWFVRGYMLDLMHQSRVLHLEVDDQISLRGFCSMNPDMKGVVSRIHMSSIKRKVQAKSVKELLTKISTDKFRPELLSMHCCLAADPGFHEKDFDNFRVGAWLTAASELTQEHGVEPHVVLVAQRCRK